MAWRPLPELSPERRAMLERDLVAVAERERRATLDKYILVASAFEAGLTVRDIAAVFGISSSTATGWKALGEQERQRRTI